MKLALLPLFDATLFVIQFLTSSHSSLMQCNHVLTMLTITFAVFQLLSSSHAVGLSSNNYEYVRSGEHACIWSFRETNLDHQTLFFDSKTRVDCWVIFFVWNEIRRAVYVFVLKWNELHSIFCCVILHNDTLHPLLAHCKCDQQATPSLTALGFPHLPVSESTNLRVNNSTLIKPRITNIKNQHITHKYQHFFPPTIIHSKFSASWVFPPHKNSLANHFLQLA